VECGDGESPLSIAEATTRGSSTLPQGKRQHRFAMLPHSTWGSICACRCSEALSTQRIAPLPPRSLDYARDYRATDGGATDVECGDGESPLSIAEATTRGSSTLTAMKAAASLRYAAALHIAGGGLEARPQTRVENQ